MHKLVILLSLVAAVYAGVGVLTSDIEAAALKLWQEHCDGESEGGTDGTTFIYCKKSKDKLEESLSHALELKGKEGAASDQVVFIQPPSYNYKHDVIVTGGGASGPKTVIYVKPAKNTHEVNIQDQTQPNAAPQKPTLYFLRGSHGESEAHVGGAGEPAAAASGGAPTGYGAADDADAPPPPAVEEEGGATRRRRENGPNAFPAVEIGGPIYEPKNKRTVYILRRAHA